MKENENLEKTWLVFIINISTEEVVREKSSNHECFIDRRIEDFLIIYKNISVILKYIIFGFKELVSTKFRKLTISRKIIAHFNTWYNGKFVNETFTFTCFYSKFVQDKISRSWWRRNRCMEWFNKTSTFFILETKLKVDKKW